jgi:GNAT superfamily N-acetyltransferase
MLDKSVPYAGLFMRRPAGAVLLQAALPDGFAFSFFEDGNESDWARIETSVLEFDSEFAALLYYKENFMPYVGELRRRCLFVSDPNGAKVATATAWWFDVAGDRRPWMHWVAVNPRFQGLGIGKAVVSRAVRLMVELEGDVDLFLKTQTWSHRAVRVYTANGFQPTDEKLLYKFSKDRKNNYKRAMRILRRIDG